MATPPDSPETYANAFPDQLMAAAAQHPVVQVRIRREYTPLLAADLYRGSVLLDGFSGPFEGSMGHALMVSSQEEGNVVISLPSPMAQQMAVRIKAGGQARRALH